MESSNPVHGVSSNPYDLARTPEEAAAAMRAQLLLLEFLLRYHLMWVGRSASRAPFTGLFWAQADRWPGAQRWHDSRNARQSEALLSDWTNGTACF